ncbi:hypothetical protein F4677DRAFT_458429 [Hypoxylon crocopeplum]|nr:hypothetical protein F4677DRAFT_458429 [Hypoxylon crocopeplum]
MDPQLKDKVEFFECLKACQYEDGEDALDADEEVHRQRSRAFFSVAPTAPPRASQASLRKVRRPPRVAPGTIPSDPISRESDPEVEIIAVTPRNNNNPGAKGPVLLKSASVGDDTPVPETEAAPTKRPQRPTTRSVLHARHSSPQSDPSPSTRMGKRKKEAPLKLVPEAQRIFKGLSFYYIPNDDINPVRRFRIIKAREHGAMWSRELANATHIIVDKRLTYADIERHLQDDPKLLEKVLVNENYPIDCIKHRIVANPDQRQYKIDGLPTSAKEPANASLSSDDSDVSLELKPRRKKVAKRTYMPMPGIPSSSENSSSHQLEQTHREASDGQSSEVQKEAAPPERTAQAMTVDDELTQCINEVSTTGDDNVLGDALIDDGDVAGLSSPADEVDALLDSSSSDDERPRKRRASDSNGGARRKDPAWQERFICMQGGTKDHTDDGPNAETIKVLQKMLDIHNLAGDNFRIRAYRLAIATLRAQSKKISTAEEARALPNIGRIADKIEEIVNTNRLRQLEYALDDPRRKILGEFLKIYGVGQSQAQKWIAQGYRTLDDVRKKAELDANQKVGLDHFDDLNTRIPRREVEALATHIKKTAALIDRRMELIVGGSYRRGADNSGDIDLIVTKGGTSSTSELAPFLGQLVGILTREGFLTAALAAHHGSTDDGSKWHGCCVLPESAFPGLKREYRPIWRRIDFLLVPQTEFGAALIYFTGNDIFNRSIRLLARKKGMRLNQRGLYTDVLRAQGNVKTTAGTLLEGREEKKIFAILGVRWREPHERWCG